MTNMHNSQPLSDLVFPLRTLSPIWTGGVVRKVERVHETGIRGSIRWWYETLVRGLGGYACDPTNDKNRCQLDPKKFKEFLDKNNDVQSAIAEQICPACQLFGCNGWAAKFRLEIRDDNDNFIQTLHKEGDVNRLFTLKFIQISSWRGFTEYEKWLLHKTLWVIATYGALGGKLTLKPQEHPNRRVSGPWGLIEFCQETHIENRKEDVKQWLQQYKKENNPLWPNLAFFFFKTGYFLNREQINKLMQELEKTLSPKDVRFFKGKSDSSNERISKKFFSFNHRCRKRFWGYCTNKDMLEAVIGVIEKNFGVLEIKTGTQVINEKL